MSKENVRTGLIAKGMVVRGVPQRRSLPQTNAGGNVQVYLEGGNRLVAWKGSHNYEVFSRLADGDSIDFEFTGLKSGEFNSSATGQMVDYFEFKGVKVIPEAETLQLDGIQPGMSGTIPSALAERPLAPEIAPKNPQTMAAAVAQEAGTVAVATDSSTEDAEC
jgi:hypothetical protein